MTLKSMHKSVLFFLFLCSIEIFVPGHAVAIEELESRFELGFNMGALTPNDRNSYLGESSFFYPEFGAWLNLGDKARFGARAGFIYVGYASTSTLKTISTFPVMLEMNILQMEESFEEQRLFMELGIGLGYFFSLGDIYENANAWSMKLGGGIMSDSLMFSINIGVIGCRAKSKQKFTYEISPGTTGSINDEMNLGGTFVNIAVGTRY